MQSQLLSSALRRRSEFHISTCAIDIGSILQAVTSAAIRVVVRVRGQFRVRIRVDARR